MSTHYVDGIEYKKCDIEGCESSQSIETCPICGKDVCWGHINFVYDTKYGDLRSVCCECIKDDKKRFLEEKPMSMFEKEDLIDKLKNRKRLSDEEIEILVELLEDN